MRTMSLSLLLVAIVSSCSRGENSKALESRDKETKRAMILVYHPVRFFAGVIAHALEEQRQQVARTSELEKARKVFQKGDLLAAFLPAENALVEEVHAAAPATRLVVVTRTALSKRAEWILRSNGASAFLLMPASSDGIAEALSSALRPDQNDKDNSTPPALPMTFSAAIALQDIAKSYEALVDRLWFHLELGAAPSNIEQTMISAVQTDMVISGSGGFARLHAVIGAEWDAPQADLLALGLDKHVAIYDQARVLCSGLDPDNESEKWKQIEGKLNALEEKWRTLDKELMAGVVSYAGKNSSKLRDQESAGR